MKVEQVALAALGIPAILGAGITYGLSTHPSTRCQEDEVYAVQQYNPAIDGLPGGGVRRACAALDDIILHRQSLDLLTEPSYACSRQPNHVYLVDYKACLPMTAFVPAQEKGSGPR